MKAKAIVYTSNTGFTERYAEMLAEATGLPVYSMDDAKKALAKGDNIIYMGWLMASHVKDYRKAARMYNVVCVCGVGLCNTGGLLDEVRSAEKIPSTIPLYTLQGGIKHGELRGIYKFMINTLVKVLSKQKSMTDEDKAKLALLSSDGDYVDGTNLADVMKWWNE